jgi:hypothetical protein
MLDRGHLEGMVGPRLAEQVCALRDGETGHGRCESAWMDYAKVTNAHCLLTDIYKTTSQADMQIKESVQKAQCTLS